MRKLTTITMALALAAGAAAAAPFRVVTDAPGSVFVLDADSGALTHCTTRTPGAAKVLDMAGDIVEARPQAAQPGQFVCTEVRQAAFDPREHRLRAILRARTGTLADLYGVPDRGGYGGAYRQGARQIGIVWPGNVQINTY